MMGMDHFIYAGSTGTIIKFNSDEQAWIVSNILDRSNAFINASGETFILGMNRWVTLRDKSCDLGDFQVSFSFCSAQEFTCDDGFCIQLEKRCNHETDCRDGSDEVDCNILRQKPGYNKQLAPKQDASFPTVENDQRLLVNVSVTIIDILNIDEVNQEIKVKMMVLLEWNDSGLTFTNLKEHKSQNKLTVGEREAIWTPELYFDDINIYYREENEQNIVLVEMKKPNFTTLKLDHASNERVFGSDTFVLLQRCIKSYTFICNFDMTMSPFDIQTCSLNFSLINHQNFSAR